MTDRERLIDRLIDQAVLNLRRSATGRGVNTLACHFLGNVARLLNRRGPAASCEELLRTAPIELFVCAHRLSLDPLATLEERFPPWSNGLTREYILAQQFPWFPETGPDEWPSILQQAGDQLEREEFLMTVAAFGNIEEALRLAREFLLPDENREANIRYVALCEALFQDRREFVDRLFAPLLSPGPSAWTSGQLALCAAHRRPWEIYPFPDY